jgi:hypothetical protein
MSDQQTNKWSSRKFLTMVAVCIGATALLLTGSISENVWQQVLAFTIIPYFAADIAPHMASVWGGKK